MTRTQLGERLEQAGTFLMIAGGACLALIFLTILIIGHWPDAFQPIRDYFRLVAQVPLFGWLIELWTFLLPGGVIYLVGQRLQR